VQKIKDEMFFDLKEKEKKYRTTYNRFDADGSLGQNWARKRLENCYCNPLIKTRIIMER
jgi:hypothetical protein